MSTKPIEERLQAVQLKYDALKDSTASLTPTSPLPMQFTRPRPRPMISVETPSEKNDAVEQTIEQTMLKYILEKYGKQGRNILSQKEENLLPLYIEGWLLNQNFTDPNGEFHTILRLVHEAGIQFQPATTNRSSCSAMRSLR